MLFVIRLCLLNCLFLCAFMAFAPYTQAAQYSVDLLKQIPYYKSPSSQFPSGSTSFERLNESRLIATPIEQTYYLYKQQKISKNLLQPTLALDLSTALGATKNEMTDKGLVLILKKTALRAQAQLKSAAITYVPEKSMLRPLRFQNGFVLVEFNKVRGYVDISHCISKFDFALAVYGHHSIHNVKQWSFVKTREFDQILLTDGSSISLNDIEALVVDETKAFVTKADESLPLWTTLKVQHETANLWTQSRMPGHGVVWWRLNNEDLSLLSTTIDDLLKREISSVSFHPKNSKKALASAKGVFITDDGQNWREISQFKGYSGPVLYFSDSLLYVGNYRSLDGGKTFENYIQIDRLSAALTDRLGFEPRRVQVRKIKTIMPSKLQIDVDIGSKIIKMQTPIYSQDWKVVKI